MRYVQAWVDQDGRAHHYFRRRGFRRVPLRGLPGSSEFMAAYQMATQEAPPPIGMEKRSKPGSIAAAVSNYLDSMLQSIATRRPSAMRFDPLPLLIAQPKQVPAHDPNSLPKNESRSYCQSVKIPT